MCIAVITYNAIREREKDIKKEIAGKQLPKGGAAPPTVSAALEALSYTNRNKRNKNIGTTSLRTVLRVPTFRTRVNEQP